MSQLRIVLRVDAFLEPAIDHALDVAQFAPAEGRQQAQAKRCGVALSDRWLADVAVAELGPVSRAAARLRGDEPSDHSIAPRGSL